MMINRSVLDSTKKWSLAILFAMCVCLVQAQTPYINSISPTSATIGEVVNITGSNFIGASSVFFGGTKASSIDVVNSNLIKATVPAGATYDHVSVLNGSSLGYSKEKFNITFDGQSVAASDVASNFVKPTIDRWATNKIQTQDLCSCDFDLDGDNDFFVSNVGDGSSADITIFTNNTVSFGTPVFAETSLSISRSATNVRCGDLNGDGYPDLIANELNGEAEIYVFINNGAGGGFSAIGNPVKIPKNGSSFRIPGKIAIKDLDLDGKPEIIAVVEEDNLIFFFKNTSTGGTASFASAEQLSATENAGTEGLGGLEVTDLNNDGLPEIIVSNFAEKGFYVFNNNSQPGAFNFLDAVYHDSAGKIRNIKVGDLNQDGLQDLVITNADITISDFIEILENSTPEVGGLASFKSPVLITGIETSWGMDFGDIDGDGDLDITAASFGTNSFYVAMNTNPSTISASSFSVAQISLTNNSRNILLTDIDNDGKPDFVFTNNSTSAGTGFLAARLNNNCLVPVISPAGTIKLCTGESVNLQASMSGYSYAWEKDNNSLGDTDYLLQNVNTLGSYTVTIQDGCKSGQITSTPVVIETPAATYTPPTYNTPTAAPCSGEAVSFTQSALNDGATAYSWSGPNGYSSTAAEPTIPSITSEQSGEYTVTMTSAGCDKSFALSDISVISLPVVVVNNSLPNYFCTGSSINLSATEFPGITYQWRKGASDFGGTDPTLQNITTGGDYRIKITGSGCSEISTALTLEVISPPASSFTLSDTVICEGVSIQYEATSTGAKTITNSWDFNDGTTTTSNSVSHAHTTAGSYTVKMTAKYDGLTDCVYTAKEATVKIVTGPTVVDFIISDNSDTGNFEKCSESSLTLRLAKQYLAYKWYATTDKNNPLTTNTTIAVADESSIFVELTDSTQCTFDSDSVSVTNYTTGGIFISTSGSNTIEDDPKLGRIINFTEEQSSIILDVNNATSPIWETAPPEITSTIIADSTALSTLVTPAFANQLIKVSGTDVFECLEMDSVTLIKPGVKADKSFTPNGDNIGDCWQISNISGTDCTVIIFDSKGRQVKEITYVPNTTADNCVWDGNKSNGFALSSGMYYYILKCSDSANESSGSIFMAR